MREGLIKNISVELSDKDLTTNEFKDRISIGKWINRMSRWERDYDGLRNITKRMIEKCKEKNNDSINDIQHIEDNIETISHNLSNIPAFSVMYKYLLLNELDVKIRTKNIKESPEKIKDCVSEIRKKYTQYLKNQLKTSKSVTSLLKLNRTNRNKSAKDYWGILSRNKKKIVKDFFLKTSTIDAVIEYALTKIYSFDELYSKLSLGASNYLGPEGHAVLSHDYKRIKELQKNPVINFFSRIISRGEKNHKQKELIRDLINILIRNREVFNEPQLRRVLYEEVDEYLEYLIRNYKSKNKVYEVNFFKKLKATYGSYFASTHDHYLNFVFPKKTIFEYVLKTTGNLDNLKKNLDDDLALLESRYNKERDKLMGKLERDIERIEKKRLFDFSFLKILGERPVTVVGGAGLMGIAFMTAFLPISAAIIAGSITPSIILSNLPGIGIGLFAGIWSKKTSFEMAIETNLFDDLMESTLEFVKSFKIYLLQLLYLRRLVKEYLPEITEFGFEDSKVSIITSADSVFTEKMNDGLDFAMKRSLSVIHEHYQFAKKHQKEINEYYVSERNKNIFQKIFS